MEHIRKSGRTGVTGSVDTNTRSEIFQHGGGVVSTVASQFLV